MPYQKRPDGWIFWGLCRSSDSMPLIVAGHCEGRFHLRIFVWLTPYRRQSESATMRTRYWGRRW